MAIIFISPQKKQKIIFWVSATAFIVLLTIISFLAVLPEIKNQLTLKPEDKAFNMPDININFIALDSPQVRDLQIFENIHTGFDYRARNAAGNEVFGTVFATSENEARNILSQRGLDILNLEKINIGRIDPFVSY